MASNVLRNYTYPHAVNRIKDESIGTTSNTLILPLHRPIVPIYAAQGKVNEIGWYTGAEAIDTFGEETFDRFSKFFRNEQVFLEQAIFPGQGCFLVRLDTDAAMAAGLVLECHVSTATLPEYQRNTDGTIKRNADTGFPLLVADGASYPGYKLKYVVRPLKVGEKFDHIAPTVTGSGVVELEYKRTVEYDDATSYTNYGYYGATYTETGTNPVGAGITVFPILAVKFKSPGAAGNRYGFKFFWDQYSQDLDVIDAVKSIPYTFAPVYIPYASSTNVPIRDIYGQPYVQFVMKPDQVDKRTARRISVEDVFEKNYSLQTGDYGDLLPYTPHFYVDNFKTIGDMIAILEDNENSEVVDGWMANILDCKTTDGVEYTHAQITTDASTATLNDITVHYLKAGQDSDLTNDQFENLFRNFLTMATIPEIQDTARYPITHIYDVGYSIETSMAMIQFMAKQKMCKVELASQDSQEDFYTMEESLSVAAALRARALLTPECEVHGTGALRAEIFGQCGQLTDRALKQIIPSTIWIAKKRSALHNTTYVRGDIKGRPNSDVDIFRNYNWIPSTPDQKQMCWDTALNYFQHADMVNLFFPDIRTIYTYTSSVLSDITFTDCCIYLMYAVQEIWSTYAGRTEPSSILFNSIKNDIEQAAFTMFAGKYKVTATPYQTYDEIQAGDIIHISTEMIGYSPARRFINDIICKRENLIGLGNGITTTLGDGTTTTTGGTTTPDGGNTGTSTPVGL